MRFRLRLQIPVLAAALGMAIGMAAQTTPGARLGIFRRQVDIGPSLRPGGGRFDPAGGRYRITGGGANIWAHADAFHFVYKKFIGDFRFATKVRLAGRGGDPHRKAVLMARQSLAPNAAYADIALHGVGLAALQYRKRAGAATREAESPVNAPAYLILIRRGNAFTMKVSRDGKRWATTGPVRVPLPRTLYLGLGVCAHNALAMQTAVFSRVALRR